MKGLPMKQIKQLSGHSGCGLLLYESGDGLLSEKSVKKRHTISD